MMKSIKIFGRRATGKIRDLRCICFTWGDTPALAFVTKASMLAEFFFALAMLWWEGLRALKIDISS